jgi:dephospho-CoA kinase
VLSLLCDTEFVSVVVLSVAEERSSFMKRILLTGLSGTGKSTLIAALAAQGYTAVDADGDAFSRWAQPTSDSDAFGPPVEAGRDWVWREDRIEELLSSEDSDMLFLAGCAENMGRFLPQFDHVVLLHASADVLVERLRTRTTNPYGKHPGEVARVLGQLDTVEPLLRRVAGYEIDTSAPLDDVVVTVLQLVQSLSTPGSLTDHTGPTLRVEPRHGSGGKRR